MSEFALHLPLNGVSFGQVSTALLREFHQRGVQPFLFTVGQSDLSSQETSADFNKWIESGIKKSFEEYNRDIPIFKLWHLNHDSLASYAKEQSLFTFYELDYPTSIEVNIANNQKNVLVSSNYTKGIFEDFGVKNCKYIPLGFDKDNFRVKNQDYIKGKIVFNLTGKLEKRKHHAKIIKAWLKKYGNHKDYVLQCAIANPFIKEADFKASLNQILEGKNYFNINFLGVMQKNSLYNDFLNSGNIIIGMSGAEGWGLPEFQSIALGKHGVILNATAYKEWATEENCVLVSPNGKEDAADGTFFKKGGPYNQGQIYTFNEDEFIDGCEKAIERYKENPINTEGLKLQEDFSYSKTVDAITEVMNA
jgi:glycosyltransferase involved in cell wall biosynthesis